MNEQPCYREAKFTPVQGLLKLWFADVGVKIFCQDQLVYAL
jgi:hypothetical protein